uniref:Uncharacterized protein n=1 Tax=Leersia perrieri TaxID=77586 RepID=A0A0D9VH55_9ORYZ
MAMEDAASEMSDWEVLSAASAHGGEEGDFVVLVSGEVAGGGGGSDVFHDHFALALDPSDAGFSGEGEWLGGEEEMGEEGLGLVDGFDSVSEGRLDLLAAEEEGDWSARLQLELGDGGVDGTIGEIERESSVLGGAVPREATLSGEERREEAEKVGIEQEKDAAHRCGELEFVPEENFNSDDAAAVAADVYRFESPENSDVQLADGKAHVEASAMGTVEKEPVQGNSGNAASGCSEPDGEANAGSFPLAESLDGGSSLHEAAAAATGDAIVAVDEEPVQDCGDTASGAGEQGVEAKDGSLPLAQAPSTGEGEKQVVVWWRLPFRLLQCCAWKVKPIWSFSIAAALLGLIVLGRRMYRMRRKARGLPQIKIAFDDKKSSQFADRTARLNEAFFMARRVPMLRTSGAVFPWSMVQDR